MVEFVEPVTPRADKKAGGPSPGIGLAVSGGGYRAMLFHLGAFLRLYEVGLLQRLDRISSVSGGSITAAKIALEWPRLKTRDDFLEHVVRPVRRLANSPSTSPAVSSVSCFPGGVARYIALAYRLFLFGGARLNDLPSKPEFSIKQPMSKPALYGVFPNSTWGTGGSVISAIRISRCRMRWPPRPHSRRFSRLMCCTSDRMISAIKRTSTLSCAPTSLSAMAGSTTIWGSNAYGKPIVTCWFRMPAPSSGTRTLTIHRLGTAFEARGRHHLRTGHKLQEASANRFAQSAGKASRQA